MIKSRIEGLKEDKNIDIDIFSTDDMKEEIEIQDYTRSNFENFVVNQASSFKSKNNTHSTKVYASEEDLKLIMEITTKTENINTSSEIISHLIDFGFRQWLEFYSEYISLLDEITRKSNSIIIEGKVNEVLSDSLNEQLKTERYGAGIKGKTEKTKVSENLNQFLEYYTDYTQLEKETLSTIFLNFGLFFMGKRSNYEFKYENEYEKIEERFYHFESAFMSHISIVLDRFLFMELSKDPKMIIHSDNYPSGKIEENIKKLDEKDPEEDIEITEPTGLGDE